MPKNKSPNKKSIYRHTSARYTKKNTKEKNSAKRGGDPERLINQLMPYILSLIALFMLICYFISDSTGFMGVFLKNLMFGLFSSAAWVVPIVIINIAVFWKRDVSSGTLPYKLSFSFLTVTFISVLFHAFASRGAEAIPETFKLTVLFKDGCQHIGGGMIGGFISNILLRGFGFAGTLIISIAFILLFGIFLFGLTPHMLAVYITDSFKSFRSYIRERIDEGSRNREESPYGYEAQRTKKQSSVVTSSPLYRQKHYRNADDGEDEFFDAADAVDQDNHDISPEPVIDPAIFDEIIENEARKQAKMSSASDGGTPFDAEDSNIVESDAPPFDQKTEVRGKSGFLHRERVKPEPKTGMKELWDLENGEIDLSSIFAENDTPSEEIAVPAMPDDTEIVTSAEIDLMIEKSRVAASENALTPGEDYENGAEDDKTSSQSSVSGRNSKSEQMKIDYAFPPISLLKFDVGSGNADMSGEIQQTATKLVETLRSFNVRTKIINVSRGPTITRYELQPEVGTKVRSIVNLVDDIALHLATSGVRIEAPIPGKEAVGIEVPNRSTSTVYIRELLEDEAFKNAKSKVTTGLGMDVAGTPVYLDVAKMPHMLIAGTTGSGKSVCINSLIISILYKARPDEVKFILIDPKKVELNVYNGIPHLLVPVVSDPRKAAGSLHWAVTEMERRYELIEGAGVRNIKGYNDSIANDPDAERLPQIVIIIDELADLMMTAKDDVEEAICRIAQKARAAGMHLIIGTQRPSVDVITGLIKANVPSRIAFTTVSQVDSRTIIDIAGAEKLIGRGDMLFSPVGCIKPMRVQGAFVSDDEVEAVTSFVKSNYGVKDYDQTVIDTIEREAQLCGNKKATVLGDGDEEANDGDPMLKPAIELAVESGKISTSLIQRRLQLGYGRAAKLIDAMEQMGIVSPPQGQKPRDVLISRQEYLEMEMRRRDLD